MNQPNKTAKAKTPQALTFFEWAVKNNLRKKGKYWSIDYSNIAYTDETIVKQFENQKYPFQK